MAFFDDLKDSVSMVGKSVSQKVNSTTESMKMSSQMKNNEKMIEKLKFQIGSQYYMLHGHETGTEYDEFVAEINRLMDENIYLKQAIEMSTMVYMCPQCGCENPVNAKFCVRCGAPIEAMQQQQAYAPGVTCGNCGTVNDPDSAFCIGCGTRLGAAPAPQAMPTAAPQAAPTPAPASDPEDKGSEG